MPGRNYTSANGYRYGFNGMEKDDEVKGAGNSYTTEFRMYDPRVSRWLSTDPVVHAGMSPYNAFDNNPIYWIDPWGSNADNYKLDKNGNISLTEKTDDDFDMLYNEDESKSLKVDKGILDDKRTNTVTDSKNNKYNLDEYDIKGDDKAKELFEFASLNTDVEWSLNGIGNKSGDEGKNILTTSHKEGSEIGGGYLFSKGYTLRYYYHNHPYKGSFNSYYSQPSTADKSFNKTVTAKFIKFRTKVFNKGKYQEYNEFGPTMAPIEITAPKN